MKISAIDLFYGIGGLSYRLQKVSIPVLAGIDIDQSSEYTYRKNIKADFVLKSIEEITGEYLNKNFWDKKKQIKVLAGCAPCQPFSTHANKIKNGV